jgi:hypothetical protein
MFGMVGMVSCRLVNIVPVPISSVQTVHPAVIGTETTARDTLETQPLIETMRTGVSGQGINEYRGDGRIGKAT